jgi:hypothetical protein
MARKKTRQEELGFYPFVIADQWGDYSSGANTPEEAVAAAKQMLRDDEGGLVVIYQAVKQVIAEPVEVEVTGVSFE